MNAMTAALKAAGTPVPSVKYRIWNWLASHPEKTAAEITTALGLSYEPGQSLVEMERGGVLKVYSDISRKTGLKGVQYKLKRYSVVNAKEYTPPHRKLPKLRGPKLVSVPTAAPAKPEFDAETHIQKLSLTQAKALYTYLHGVFR